MIEWHWPDLDGPSTLALHCMRAAIERADPVAATEHVLDGRQASSRTWILALGKAANGMSLGAVRWLKLHGFEPAGGIVISHVEASAPHPALVPVTGDHPVPGEASLRAAGALGLTVAEMRPRDSAIVLLSGGASSLVAAPVESLEQDDLATLTRALLASGAPIDVINTIRRRVLRWAGGRLAAALSPAAVTAIAISDVPGDDPRVIGSGPVTGWQQQDESFGEALAVLPAGARGPLERAWRAGLLDLPRGQYREVLIAASNPDAVEAAAHVARQTGWKTETRPGSLKGEASVAGRSLAGELRALPRGTPRCIIVGGETTVTLGTGSGTGGRSQELALAAARELSGEPGVMLLAAGTDGRDGPTDAAGALVDGNTWSRIPDGDGALERHDSHAALAAAGALVRTGATGTNVMDLVIALRW
jgi:hydroxypyruvate reductase